ncbi:MAG: hypothetical protein IM592_11285 [Bacteroidetes bacterium]|nr:hypothetical protein [Bacteroidota bacterium]
MELTEFEERAINACRRYKMDDDYALEDFVEDLRKIMPPTCTKTERKFLDEIKEKAKLIRPNVYAIFPEPLKLRSVIFAKDFEANLSELVEGKQ